MMAAAQFDYTQAFSSNLGLLTPEEQDALRRATIAIPGMGGVGGAHLLTLSRVGIGGFSIADGDAFELRNFNRQPGATVETLGAPKVEVMASMARAINPALRLRTQPQPITRDTIDAFLDGCDVVVDALDFFAIGARRLVFARAHARRIPVITCGPLGFSVALLLFMPEGPSFDAFLGLTDQMDEREQLFRFAVALAPRALHLPYVDPRAVDLAAHRGPSSAIAIQLCAGVAAMEAVNLLTRRRPPLAVPRYAQFDPYRLRYHIGTLRLGNRHPWQQVKLWYLKRRFPAAQPSVTESVT